MNGAIICLDSCFGSLCVHRVVGEQHAVGRAVGLTLITVLIVHHVVFGLAALDLMGSDKNRQDLNTVGIRECVQCCWRGGRLCVCVSVC